jgi:lysophospholipase L1-like esterase
MVLRRILFVTALLVAGGCSLLKSSTTPTEVAPHTVNYAALGASDTIGYGSSSPCLPFVDCMVGTGYVQRTAQRLQAAGNTVTLVNLGVPGAVLSPDLQAAGNAIGLDILRNLLTDESSYVPHNATLSTVFIGGNDVNTVGSLIKAGKDGGNTGLFIQTQTQKFGQDLGTMVKNMHDRSPTVRVIALNLPNMGALPYAAGRPVEERRTLQQIAVGFSAQINALASSNVIVIDLMCDGNFYNPATFSSDGFHPNDAGYAYLSDLVYAAAQSGTATPPRATCSFMTVY